MAIPTGTPLVNRVVKGGSGGPGNDSIPVKEDLGGATIGYLKNDTIVQIVDPTWSGASKYRHAYNSTTWVDFLGGDFISRINDYLCEETGHLLPVNIPPVETTTVEVIEERITNGRKFLTFKKV